MGEGSTVCGIYQVVNRAGPKKRALDWMAPL